MGERNNLKGWLWQVKIDVAKEFRAAEEGNLSVQELSKLLASKLEMIPEHIKDYELEDIITDFWSGPTTPEHFDEILERLYDWGDDGKRLFINHIN